MISKCSKRIISQKKTFLFLVLEFVISTIFFKFIITHYFFHFFFLFLEFKSMALKPKNCILYKLWKNVETQTPRSWPDQSSVILVIQQHWLVRNTQEFNEILKKSRNFLFLRNSPLFACPYLHYIDSCLLCTLHQWPSVIVTFRDR